MLKLEKTLLTPSPNPWSYSVAGLALIAFTALSLVYWEGGSFATLLTASREQIFDQHQYWRLFTTMAVHADLRHLLSNAFFFWIFGFLLNAYFGLWVFPIMSVAAGALINGLTLATYPAHSVLLGASGVVYFMAGLWATLYYCIERGEKHLKRIVSVIGVSLVLFFPTSFEPQVSYLAHAWGFALGIPSGLMYFFGNKERIRSHEVWRETEPQQPYELPDDHEWMI